MFIPGPGTVSDSSLSRFWSAERFLHNSMGGRLVLESHDIHIPVLVNVTDLRTAFPPFVQALLTASVWHYVGL